MMKPLFLTICTLAVHTAAWASSSRPRLKPGSYSGGHALLPTIASHGNFNLLPIFTKHRGGDGRSLKLAIADSAQAWGMGVPPWDILDVINEKCPHLGCKEVFNVSTLVAADTNSAPVMGKVTLAVDGVFWDDEKGASREEMVNWVNMGLRAMWDTSHVEYMAFADRTASGSISELSEFFSVLPSFNSCSLSLVVFVTCSLVALIILITLVAGVAGVAGVAPVSSSNNELKPITPGYEPIYVAPNEIYLEFDPAVHSHSDRPFLRIRFEGNDKRRHSTKLCESLSSKGRDIYNAYQDELGNSLQSMGFYCIWVPYKGDTGIGGDS